VTNLVKNPTTATNDLFAIAQTANLYAPALSAAPQAWLVTLLYTDTNLYASGRIAIDAQGNMWTNNNWQPGTLNPSNNLNVLNTVGVPILGSPIYGGGLDGQGWGNAIAPDGTVWIGNYHAGSISKFSADGKPLSPDTGWNNGDLSFVQGMAFDQQGNLWIANNTGKDTPPGSGSIVVYPNGDPSKAFSITGGGIDHPFAVQIDDLGRAWVSNGGIGFEGEDVQLADKLGGSMTIINPDFSINPVSPITSSDMRRPMGIALDSKGNAWVAGFDNDVVFQISPDGVIAGTYKLGGTFNPWGVAIDGSDRVWVTGFRNQSVFLLCGVNTAACPPGSKTGDLLSPGTDGFKSPAFQHFTSIQFDESGNIWLSNNWSTVHPVAGGVGVVKIPGLATPVCTPLLGQPVRATAAANCPKPTAATMPATGGAFDNAVSLQWIFAIGLLLLCGGLILIYTHRARGNA
jgi:streptogramin lyase